MSKSTKTVIPAKAGIQKTKALVPRLRFPEFREAGEWEIKSLRDVCNVLQGYGFPTEMQGKHEGKYPFCKVSDVSKAVAENGVEYWFARDLQHLLGYSEWRNFLSAITKTKTACEVSGHDVGNYFVDVNKIVELGSGSQREISDIMLTRFPSFPRMRESMYEPWSFPRKLESTPSYPSFPQKRESMYGPWSFPRMRESTAPYPSFPRTRESTPSYPSFPQKRESMYGPWSFPRKLESTAPCPSFPRMRESIWGKAI